MTPSSNQPSDSASLPNLYPQAMADLKAKQYPAALDGFNQVLKAEPTYAPGFLGRAIAQFHLGLARAAVADAQRAAQLQPSLASAPEVMAKAHTQLGNLAQAIAAYKQAARLYLTATPPDKNRAQSCITKAEQLQQDTQRPTVQGTIDPTLSSEAYLKRAIERCNAQDYAAALIDLNWLLQFEPDNVEALCHRAEVQGQLGQKEAAVRDMAKVLELEPENQAIKLRRACLRMTLGDAIGAIADLTHLMEPGKPNTRIFLHRAQAHQQLGHWEDAFKDYSNGLGAGVDEPALYQGRAEVRWETRDLDGAIEDFSHAATLWLNRGEGDRYRAILDRVEQLKQAQTAQKAEEEAAQANIIRIPVLYQQQGTPVVAAVFNEHHRVELTLSTGTPFTVIPRSLANQLDYTPMGSIWFRTVDGQTVQAETGCVQKIQVGLAETYLVRVVIAEWETAGYLGQSFFGAYDLRILADEIELHRRAPKS